MKHLITMLLLAISTGSFATVIKVQDGFSRSYDVVIDTSSIKKNKNTISVNYKIQNFGTIYGVSTMAREATISCSTNSYKLSKYINYDPEGDVVSSGDDTKLGYKSLGGDLLVTPVFKHICK